MAAQFIVKPAQNALKMVSRFALVLDFLPVWKPVVSVLHFWRNKGQTRLLRNVIHSVRVARRPPSGYHEPVAVAQLLNHRRKPASIFDSSLVAPFVNRCATAEASKNVYLCLNTFVECPRGARGLAGAK